jgi:tetratricopeptide (TPR) repeat protein
MHAPAEVYHKMFTGASFPQRARRLLSGILALGWIFNCATADAAQHPAPSRSKTQQSSPAPSPFLEAEALLRQGSIAEAKSKAQEQLQLNPSSVEGYNLLGIIYSNEQDFVNALEAFQHALKLAPSSTKTLNNLGNVYAARQKFDLAEKEFRKVLSIDPANNDGNYNLGLVLMAGGSPTEAISHFQRVRPANAQSNLNLIRANLQAGRVAEGLRLAKDFSAQHNNGEDAVQQHFTLGVLLASEKQYRAGQLELEKANALQPDTFEILYNLGQAYVRNKDYAKAEPALNRALKLNPDSPETMYLMAQAKSDQGDAATALDLLVRARKLASQNTDIILLLARISMSQNYFEDAIPLLESGVKIAPQRADLYAALGESYFTAGKTEKAIQEFQTLIQLAPTGQSYAFMGLAYRYLGRFDEARTYFQKGLKQNPGDATCLFNLGYLEEGRGNHAAAETLFQQALHAKPDLTDALLELANLRIAEKKFAEAAVLLRKYVKVSRDPASGYYKLAMVERSLHQTEAAERDLNVFQTLSKTTAPGPYPYQHFFDYVENRSQLPPQARTEQDLDEVIEQVRVHPDQPQNLYLLAETYLKLGKLEDARRTIVQLDQLSAGDYRTQTGIGVLLARYRLYDDAIQHFQTALGVNPESDDVKFDLASAYFRKGLYPQALEAAGQMSLQGQRDDAALSLLGDIYAHQGETARAAEIFRSAISRNPDNDQYYLSLTLVQLRANDIDGAEDTLTKGLARMPGSGKIQWGLGLVSVLEGKTAQAAEHLERAVNLLPEWPGSYSTLGVFYYQTGQIAKAREVLDRFKNSHTGGLDVTRIEEALSKAPAANQTASEPMSNTARRQLLQMALSLADRTL